MDATCLTDARRDAVRATAGRNGLDYVEVGDDPHTLYAYFLGKLPPELQAGAPDLSRRLSIDGGDVVTGLRIVDVDPVVDADPEHDDHLVVRIDRAGDRSLYTLHLVGVGNIDPCYSSAEFRFGIDCACDLDCEPVCECPPPALDEPQPNYLAKDYASLRRLLLDRLALLMPGWQERHVPDLGITLVELLAYVGDHLSYYQDAVATEAYLGTARQRISVRRHARLVDYRLHEGTNARAWVHVGVDADTPALAASSLAFVTSWHNGPSSFVQPLAPEALAGLAPSAFEWFEPVAADPRASFVFLAAHSRISFYGWGRRSCCLPAGSTSATLLDRWQPDGTRALRLATGDVLVFAEVRGPHTGLPEDADPARRWAVRLTAVTPDEDAVVAPSRPTPVLRIAWSRADALPFAMCLSAVGEAPGCEYLEDVSVAWGNIVLVDHGRTLPHEALGPVPASTGIACCECEGQPEDVVQRTARWRPRLASTPLTHRQAGPAPTLPASRSLQQDPRQALPSVRLTGQDGAAWAPVFDLLASGADDRDFVVEIDNDGRANLRFGDGELGRQPDPGERITAQCRVGQGSAGNVGAGSIRGLVIDGPVLDGVSFDIGNPLPAQGGTDPETLAEAQQFAPLAFRRRLLRAITAGDYAHIAAQSPELQGAQAALVWTGSWYEADVALDPWSREATDSGLFESVRSALEKVRRIGHDLRVQRAVYVPLVLRLAVCAKPGFDRGHVKAALQLQLVGAGGLFDSDRLSFGQGVYLSHIVAAAMAAQGVMGVTVTEFHRWGEPSNHEIQDGQLPLAANEIAELANDPDHPERGFIDIHVEGGA